MWRLKDIEAAQTVDEIKNMETPGFWETLAARKIYGTRPKDIEAAKVNRIDTIQRAEAAPILAEANRLKRFAAVDPYIGSDEGLKDFADRPEFWLAPENGTIDNTGVYAKDKKATAGAFGTGSGANPYTQGILQQFATDNLNQADMYAAVDGDRRAQARLAMDGKLPQQFHQVMQGEVQRSEADKKLNDIEQNKAVSNDLLGFQQSIASINGGTTRSEAVGPYADPNEAFKTVPVENDPNGRTFVRTDTGNLMPFEEVTARVQQAYADNPSVPREVVKNVLDDFRLQYESSGRTTTGQVGRTTFQKFDPALGKPTITKEDVQPAPARITVNNGSNGTDSQIESWVKQIRAGNATLNDVPARGSVRNRVVDYLTLNHPDANLTELKAGKKWTESIAAGTTLSLIDATKGILTDMKESYKSLGRTGIPAANWLQDKYQEYTGSEARADFMSLKNYGVQEVEKTLSGSGAMSDHRIKLAFDNLKNSSTGPQFATAVKGLEKVLAERDKATRTGPFPNAKTPISEPAQTGTSALQNAAAAELKRRQGGK